MQDDWMKLPIRTTPYEPRLLELPIRASPYRHQLEACRFVLKLFDLFDEDGDDEEDGQGDL